MAGYGTGRGTAKTMARARDALRAQREEALGAAYRECETAGCVVDISGRDPTARFCLACVRIRVEGGSAVHRALEMGGAEK